MSMDWNTLPVRCPKCRAKADEPCVYVSGDHLGKPTQRYHAERRHALDRKRHREARRDWENDPVNQALLARQRELAALRPVIHAQKMFELGEARALRRWLRANGHLFESLG